LKDTQLDINREYILNRIFDHFQQITQWNISHIDSTIAHYYKAEGLIELLEILDCGSVGGYDPECPYRNVTGHRLYNRFLTLVRKEDSHEKIKKICYFDLDSMTQYFTKITGLREDFNVKYVDNTAKIRHIELD